MAPSAVGPAGGQATKEGVHGLGAPQAHEQVLAGVADFRAQAGVAVDLGPMGLDEAVEGGPDALGIVSRRKPRLKSGHDPRSSRRTTGLEARGAPQLPRCRRDAVYS